MRSVFRILLPGSDPVSAVRSGLSFFHLLQVLAGANGLKRSEERKKGKKVGKVNDGERHPTHSRASDALH